MSITLRAASEADLEFILANTRELARVEGRPEAVTVSRARLGELLFGTPPQARALVFEREGSGGERVGHAWVYDRVPTFTGRPVLHLEDFVIVESARRAGIGRRAMALLAEVARREGYDGMSWTVVNENREVFRFYERLGAVATGVTPFRLGAEAMEAWARTAREAGQPGEA